MDNDELYILELVRTPKVDPNYGNGSGGVNSNTNTVQVFASPGSTGGIGASGGTDINNYPIVTNAPSSTASSISAAVPATSQVGASTYSNSKYTVINPDSSIAYTSSPPPSEIIVYKVHFRVSQYNTFNDKIAAWTTNKQVTPGVGTYAFANHANLEPFDIFELEDYKDAGPLVSFVPNFNGNSWYQNEVKPVIYDNYPSTAAENGHFNINLRRDKEPLGLPPIKKHVKPVQYLGNDLYVRSNWAEAGVMPAWATGEKSFKVQYNVPIFFKMDFEDLKEEISDGMEVYLNDAPSHCNYVPLCNCQAYPLGLFKDIHCGDVSAPIPPSGLYKVIAKYRLPGEESGHSFFETHVQK